MRRYDDPVEVRKGWVGDGTGDGSAGVEGPEQFLWRGRLWKVRAVLAHWVETAPWWQSSGVRAVLGSEEGTGRSAEGGEPRPRGSDLLVERELWRVEAGRGGPDSGGVFDLSFDWSDGRWQLVGCVD